MVPAYKAMPANVLPVTAPVNAAVAPVNAAPVLPIVPAYIAIAEKLLPEIFPDMVTELATVFAVTNCPKLANCAACVILYSLFKYLLVVFFNNDNTRTASTASTTTSTRSSAAASSSTYSICVACCRV